MYVHSYFLSLPSLFPMFLYKGWLCNGEIVHLKEKESLGVTIKYCSDVFFISKKYSRYCKYKIQVLCVINKEFLYILIQISLEL